MKPYFGLSISFPEPGILERVGQDWDWIWLDAQHGLIADYRDLLALVRTCDFIDRPAFLRIPGHDPSWVGLALDMKVKGVIVPQVDSAEQARALVRAAKFPPVGNRSYGSRRIADMSGKQYHVTANQDTMLVCQIESPEGLEEAEAIAAVEGVDALFLGPSDMLLRCGRSLDAPHTEKELGGFMKTLAEACRKHGKQAFNYAIGEEMITSSIRSGFQWIAVSGEAALLARASKAASGHARDIAAAAVAA